MAWLGWSFVVLTLLFNVPISLSAFTSEIFEAWCKEHGKTYSSDQEKLFRLKIFLENYEFVTHHNSQSNSPYKMSLNAFSDLTDEEFKSSHLGFHWDPSKDLGKLNYWPVYKNNSTDVEDDNIPSSVDWRTKGAVTPVKNQGNCGCCWAFASTGAIEGINKIVTGNLISLSEQQLVDCDTSHNNGCNGGIMQYAYQYVIGNGGLTTEENYPYQAWQSQCDANKASQRVVSIDDYASIPAYDEKSLLKAVAAQPVSAAICGSERAFKSYSQGIFYGPCSTSLDHAVLIVGYGTTTDGSVDYWIVKNSWGTSWGVNGYMYMLRNSGSPSGVCGINKYASVPLKTSPNPSHNPSVGPNQSLIEKI